MMKRSISFVCAALMVPALVSAQPKTADDFYKEGETQYNLGNFLPAVEAFKKGYELEPDNSKKAAYLYNVAQSYRQAKDCSQAQFFYKRYIALKSEDKVKPLRPEKRADIEAIIKDLDVCVQQQEALKNRQPDTTNAPDNEVTRPDGKPNKGGGSVGSVDEQDEDEDSGITKRLAPAAPSLLSLRVTGGAGKVFAGPDIEVPVQPSFVALAGYPLEVAPKTVLDLGAGLSFMPIPLQGMGTATLMSVFANAAASYEVAPKISLRGDLGFGVLLFGGISESRFTAGRMTSGALSMIHLRVGLSADYAITRNLIATLTPFAFSYSPPKTGLDESITSITGIDFMAGLGYRM
ncbi:MAG: tetratricopeptide repeat protein [Kofleriaceae bacterium]|nr:tetratricopeptide repeat protein [Kofleriaceae bacterium]